MIVQWNKVTWYSKLLAVVLFVLTFYIGFCLGQQKSEVAKLTPAKDTTLLATDFTFPKNIGTTYIQTVDWPPQVQVSTDPFTCTKTGKEVALAGQTTQKKIGTHIYCLTKEIEGAAGSTYTNYTYATTVKNSLIYITFSLRAPQCGNYNDPKKTECEKERIAFNVDKIINNVVEQVN